jgi:hypothetical protein
MNTNRRGGSNGLTAVDGLIGGDDGEVAGMETLVVRSVLGKSDSCGTTDGSGTGDGLFSSGAYDQVV